MNISAVICARNAEQTIKECLESVSRNETSEIIVVDGNSTDNTVRIARQFTDKVYPDDGKGLAYARQLGAEKASGEYIAFVDSDVVLPDECLAIMQKEMEEKHYAAIHAQIISLENRSYWEWAEGEHFKAMFNREGERHAIGTIAAIFQRSKIIEYRFDPFFSGASEDADLCHRLRESGFVLGVSSASAYHRHRASARSFARQRRWYGKGNARFLWKHHSVKALLGSPAMIPFGILVCIKKQSMRMLPYYFVWSVAATYGMLSELTLLSLRRLVPNVPK